MCRFSTEFGHHKYASVGFQGPSVGSKTFLLNLKKLGVPGGTRPIASSAQHGVEITRAPVELSPPLTTFNVHHFLFSLGSFQCVPKHPPWVALSSTTTLKLCC